jgi:hypothetical protein
VVQTQRAQQHNLLIMDTELQQKIQALADALDAFKAEHPEEYAAAAAELQGHVDAIENLMGVKA